MQSPLRAKYLQETLHKDNSFDVPKDTIPWTLIHSQAEKNPEHKDEIHAQVRQRILKEPPKLDSTLSADVCDECGVQMMVIANDSMLACARCAKTRVITSANAWNSSMDADFSTLNATQKSRVLEWLEIAQAKEQGDIDESLLKALCQYLFDTKQTKLEDPAIVQSIHQEYLARGPFLDIEEAKKRLEHAIQPTVLEDCMKSLDHIAVRNALKSISQPDARKLCERSAKISSVLTGQFPERLSASQEEYIRKLFMTATPVYNRYRRSAQPNWPGGQPYLLRCLLILLGWDEIAAHFPNVIATKNPEREEQRREIWNLLRWEFVPSTGALSAVELPDGTMLRGELIQEADRRSKQWHRWPPNNLEYQCFVEAIDWPMNWHVQTFKMFSFEVEGRKRHKASQDPPWFHGQSWTCPSVELERIESQSNEKPPQALTNDIDSESDDSELDINVLCDTQEKNASEVYVSIIARSQEQVLEEMSAPQRSVLWLKARESCITASQFGAAVGHHPQTTPTQMLIEKLWHSFQGNPATEWGTLHEPDAAKTFEHFAKNLFPSFQVREYGLLKSEQCPYIGVSPDGILYVPTESGIYDWYILEYKCPFQLKDTEGHPYQKWPLNVPPQYRDQIQGISGYLANTHVHALYDRLIRKEPLHLAPKPKGSFFVKPSGTN